MSLEPEDARAQARLFTLRIWSVAGDAAPLWRARLQDVRSGEVLFFKDWQEMIARIEESLNDQNNLVSSV